MEVPVDGRSVRRRRVRRVLCAVPAHPRSADHDDGICHRPCEPEKSGAGVSGAREAGQQVAHPRLSGDDRQLPADDVLHHRVRLDAVLLLPDGQRPVCRCDQ